MWAILTHKAEEWDEQGDIHGAGILREAANKLKGLPPFCGSPDQPDIEARHKSDKDDVR